MEREKLVLLVEPDAVNCRALEWLLKENGYRVACAADTDAGLEYLWHGEAPDLILMHATGGMEGCSRLLDKVRSTPATRSVPIVVVSPEGKCLCRVEATLVGPVEHPELLETIRALC